MLIAVTTLFAAMPRAAAGGLMRERIYNRIKQGRQRDLGGAEVTTLAGIKVAIWKPGSLEQPAPLVIFSHGLHGLYAQSISIMKALSDRGYIVVAPNHEDALGNGHMGRPQQPLGQPDQWNDETYRDRKEDIMSVLAALKADPKFQSKIDWSKISLMGHSLGGYTVLGLAGAWPSWKLPGIKAVIALSPYSNPFVKKHTLSGLNVPVMYQCGTMDFGVTPFLTGKRGAFDQTSAPAYLVEIQGANHFTWSNLNRNQAHEKLIDHYCLAFLDKYVQGDPSADPSQRLPGVKRLLTK